METESGCSASVYRVGIDGIDGMFSSNGNVSPAAGIVGGDISVGSDSIYTAEQAMGQGE